MRTIEYETNTNKKCFYTFRINQITFNYSKRKKEQPNFYEMFGKNLPYSAAFTAILKLKLPQCNAIGVSTPPGGKRHHTSICGSSREVKTEGVLTAHRSENKEVIYPIILVEIDGFVRLK